MPPRSSQLLTHFSAWHGNRTVSSYETATSALGCTWASGVTTFSGVQSLLQVLFYPESNTTAGLKQQLISVQSIRKKQETNEHKMKGCRVLLLVTLEAKVKCPGLFFFQKQLLSVSVHFTSD